MPDVSPTDEPDLQEELTAYLDGELSADDRARVEQRLARDPHYYGELRRLQQAWDVLDDLPRATVDESFTRTTIEMVAIAAEEDLAATQAQQPRRQRLQAWVLTGFLFFAGMCGFIVGRRPWADSQKDLLRDLPVIEHLEEFHPADDIEFLRLLHREGLFANETDEVPHAP